MWLFRENLLFCLSLIQMALLSFKNWDEEDNSCGLTWTQRVKHFLNDLFDEVLAPLIGVERWIYVRIPEEIVFCTKRYVPDGWSDEAHRPSLPPQCRDVSGVRR